MLIDLHPLQKSLSVAMNRVDAVAANEAALKVRHREVNFIRKEEMTTRMIAGYRHYPKLLKSSVETLGADFMK